MASALLSSISERLSKLSIVGLSNEDSKTATELKTYAFKPKGSADSPKLVLVVVENAKDIGRASNLAKKLGSGIKDMRAAEDGYIKEITGGDGKDGVSPLSVTQDNASSILIVLSDSISSTSSTSTSISIPSANTSLSSSDLLKYLNSTSVNIKDFTFSEKGSEAPPSSIPAANVPMSETSNSGGNVPVAKATGSGGSSKPSANSPEDLLQKPSNLESLGVTIKKDSDDFGGWYKQVLTYGDMLDYYDVSGCYILKPASYGIWEFIQEFFNTEIKALGVQNCYFPMFVSSRVLEREKDHIEGFAPEVAWVTRAGNSDLPEPVAIRPTSETVMYPYYAKWIRSHRDLPLKLNQWNSVVRWEFKNPQPFLRTREFLWQEGHTAFLRKPEADKEVLQILDVYRRIYEDMLAVHVIPGIKSEKEKFAGGLYTTTVEGFVPTTGRGIQGGTSHCLGQNFSKMFDITVEDPDKPAGGESSKIHVWQNSWGLSTRTLGVMVMVHGDDKGLVIPPRVAQIQVQIVPCGITTKTTEEQRKELLDKCVELGDLLRKTKVYGAPLRVKDDIADNRTPGFKFNDGEMRGIPLRLEIGPQDLKKSQTLSVRRDTGAKVAIPLESASTDVPKLLETIQNDLFDKAKDEFESRLKVVNEWKDFVPTLNNNCICVIPWCEVEQCEDDIKDRSAEESKAQLGEQDERAPSAGAKSLCIPFNQDRWGAKIESTTKCTGCGKAAKRWTLFGRSY